MNDFSPAYLPSHCQIDSLGAMLQQVYEHHEAIFPDSISLVVTKTVQFIVASFSRKSTFMFAILSHDKTTW
jgi:hypothetical protein